MALDWPAFSEALWLVSDQLGIRPEWQLPVISLETARTFDPAIMNPGGCVGLNQLCPKTYPKYVSVPVSEYRTWAASKQLSGPVLDYWRDAERFGEIRSATRLMLSQLGQGLLRTAPDLDSTVFSSPSIEYGANSGFDTEKKGRITVRDLANALTHHARSEAVQDALARAYAMRPWERAYDPVYGLDFGAAPPFDMPVTPPVRANRVSALFAAATLLAFVAAAGYGASQIGRTRRQLGFRYDLPQPPPDDGLRPRRRQL